jgi:hypothetical protein
MSNSFEYNFNSNPSGPLPEIINTEGNEYLFPVDAELWSIIIEALEEFNDKTSEEEKKNKIDDFFNAISKLDTENLLGKILGYYLVTDYKNHKWKESKKIRIEIKIKKEENEKKYL